ncbi:putative leader peptide [Streptomyces sp. CNQ085]|uniref:putative leader peptide n=1 Tax=Streptomyces sp. CNQ085 TaxID=2886944 RepID=UPI0035B27AE5
MVNHDVSDTHPGKSPGTLLVARLHVDLCRLASALGSPRHREPECRRRAADRA